MYQAIYKCRLCGEEFRDCVAGETIAQEIMVDLIEKGTAENSRCKRNLYKNATHFCKDGSFGLSDFQGFKKSEDDIWDYL